MVSIANGLWWDHSKPAILAPTLTLPVDSGYLLLSGLTFLVTLAGASCWSITAFMLHHWKAKDGPVSTLDLQYRVSLRKSASAARTLWDVFRIHHAWSAKRPKKLLRRSLSVAIPAILVSACFTIAALFTSRVANKAYGPVIARAQPQDCGIPDLEPLNADPENVTLYLTKVHDDTIRARNYVANFYNNNVDPPAGVLSTFMRSRFPYQTHESAPCPIPAAERCVGGPNEAFSATTDFLDSHETLGINAKFLDRVSLKLRTTCSPIQIRDFTKIITSPAGTFVEISLGSILHESNLTYRYNVAMANNTGIGYTLSSFFAFAPNSTSTQDTLSNWYLLPDFQPPSADVSIHFLSQNDMRYTAPVLDPWFAATGTFNYTYKNNVYIVADAFVSTLICAEQYAMCNPSTGRCTPLGGILQPTENLRLGVELGYNDAQFETAARLLSSLQSAGTFNTVSSLGADALWAKEVTTRNMSPGLPRNQWRREVEGWFQTGLARLQAIVVEFAVKTNTTKIGGREAQDKGRFGTKPLTEGQRDQCKNQLVRAVGEVQNFSLVGVLVIVCVSSALIVMDFSLERVVDVVESCFGRRTTARDAREVDGKLHLVRVALAAAVKDAGDWELGSWGVPVLGRGDRGMRFATCRQAGCGGSVVGYGAWVTIRRIESGCSTAPAGPSGAAGTVSEVDPRQEYRVAL
ncbi:hypothetical protein VTI74DRAFT_599 [Chaetomium olivicolor]